MEKQPNSYDCVICGMRNGASVGVSFYDTLSDTGEPEVHARFTGRPIHQGYPDRMHGGIITGVLDEVMGRAINAGKAADAPTIWGVAAEVTTKFHQPVPLEVELTARGRITQRRRRLFEGSGEIYLPDGTLAASARARYVQLRLDAIADVEPTDLGWRVYADEPTDSIGTTG